MAQSAVAAAAAAGMVLDPPHMVNTGACCSFCLACKDPLMRCSACIHAWYCGRDCQAAHYKEHKPFCKTLKLFSGLHADLPPEIRPKTSKEFYIQRLNSRQLLEPMIRRHLTRLEARAIVNEAKCSVCFRTRDQLPKGCALECCPACRWGWACSDHYEDYMKASHRPVCGTYQIMNSAQLLVQAMISENGRLPSYCPTGDKLPLGGSRAQAPVPLPTSGWAEYRSWRPLPPIDPIMFAVVSKRLSQAMTVAAALQHHYTRKELRELSVLSVHVLGASGYEVPADNVWEELLHLTPHAQVLHVAFIGPELQAMMEESANGMVADLSTCPSCTSAGRVRRYSYHFGTYHTFLKQQQQAAAEAGGAGKPGSSSSSSSSSSKSGVVPPATIAVAFNSGIYEEERELWKPTLQALIAAGTPCVFTSYNPEESKADAAAWEKLGGKVTLAAEENPYRATEPILEPGQVDIFYYQNYYRFCGKGAAANNDGSGSSSDAAKAGGSSKSKPNRSAGAGSSSRSGGESVAPAAGPMPAPGREGAAASSPVSAATAPMAGDQPSTAKSDAGAGRCSGSIPASQAADAAQAGCSLAQVANETSAGKANGEAAEEATVALAKVSVASAHEDGSLHRADSSDGRQCEQAAVAAPAAASQAPAAAEADDDVFDDAHDGDEDFASAGEEEDAEDLQELD